ncbi:cytochrome P450, partial [Auricularia subglabra TFB-10046 SS5]
MFQLASGAAILFLVGVAYIARQYLSARSALPLPPGPPAHGVLGNVADIPTSNEWEVYTEMGKKYGAVIHLRILTRRIIVLNNLQVAMDLLNKRSNIYSDRPTFVLLNDLAGWGWTLAGMSYGEMWRAIRRIFHSYFLSGGSERYRDLLIRSNIAFLRALLDTPQNFMQHIRTLPARNILSSTYGIDVADSDDPWVRLADESIQTISEAGLPGSYAVDWLPILRFVPTWFPGASFKRKARHWLKLSSRMRSAPLEHVKENLRGGEVQSSMVASLLQNGLDGRSVSEEIIGHAAGMTYLGGADTSVSLVTAFFLSMVLHPPVQKRAQEEIDRVLGHARLPEFGDRELLPYVGAVLLEVMRLYPVLPLSLPRRVMEEDEYMGMRIPKGATVLPNLWAMLRDENFYANPHEFTPERYLNPLGQLDHSRTLDPRNIVFGFGRRLCPGRIFADDAAWLAITTVLACFDIGRAVNERGEEIVPSGEMRSGLVACPRPFMCRITPRSEATRRLALELSEQ